MSQELTAELLDIENKIGKLEANIDRIEDIAWKKSGVHVERRFFESLESYLERSSKADDEQEKYEQSWQPQIDDWKKQIKDLEERKKQINEQLFAGMDESEDF